MALEKIVLIDKEGNSMAVNRSECSPTRYPQDELINYQNVLYQKQEDGSYAYLGRLIQARGIIRNAPKPSSIDL